MSRRLFPMLVSIASGSALAQDGHLPNAAPLQSMQQAHSYSLLNQSSQIIVSATMRMTNHDERDLTWDQPVQPHQGRNIAVPANDCLSVVEVKFKSGQTPHSSPHFRCDIKDRAVIGSITKRSPDRRGWSMFAN